MKKMIFIKSNILHTILIFTESVSEFPSEVGVTRFDGFFIVGNRVETKIWPKPGVLYWYRYWTCQIDTRVTGITGIRNNEARKFGKT